MNESQDDATFAQLGLSQTIGQVLSQNGLHQPTPIQQKVIPTTLIGKDVLGVSQTGTGKTASFLLPIIDILSVTRARARIPRALILSPTRELALQTAKQAEMFSEGRGLNLAILIGGTHGSEHIRQLQLGADIVIATPGRLSDTSNRGQIILSGIKIAVIDEADRMLDMGFIPAVTEIFAKLPVMRQTLMFTATLPKDAKALAQKFLTNPKEIHIKPSLTTAKLVQQTFVRCPSSSRYPLMMRILRKDPPERGIVFCNRKIVVDQLCEKLQKAGFQAIPMHGDLPQPVRQKALETLRTQPGTILICSDVAARGLDVSDVSHVYNFDFPLNADDYIHRIGRTGRAGKFGKAVSFFYHEDEESFQNLQVFLKGTDFHIVNDSSLNKANTQPVSRPRSPAVPPVRQRRDVRQTKKPGLQNASTRRSQKCFTDEDRPAFLANCPQPSSPENRFNADNLPAFLRPL